MERHISLLVFIILACATSVTSTKNIFILAGQSNMAGRGGVNTNNIWDGIIPAECEANPAILRLNAELEWEEAKEPLHRGIDLYEVVGIGPGMAFASSLLKRDPTFGEISLVPCAAGGTSISQWSRGSQLYNRLLVRAQAAALNGTGGVIRGLLWYQGEADTWNLERANLYKSRLQQFFTDVRSDLQSPSLPVVQVALASAANWSYIDIVRKAQLDIGLLNVKCVDAKGLQLEPDWVHLNAASQVRLGAMMAEAFLQIG